MRKEEVFEGKFMKHPFLLVPGSHDEYRSMVMTITGPVVWSEPFQDGKRQRVIGFKETDKKLGLNTINWNSIAKISKIDDDDKWEGVRVELWVDEQVQFGNDIVSAIRIRKAPGTTTADLKAAGLTPASDLPLATKATAWAAWKRAGKSDALEFKKQCDIEAANTGTPIENFTAINWASVSEAHTKPITEDDIPF